MCRTCVICSGLSQLQTCAREIPQLHFGTVTFLAKVWDSEIKWGECKIKFEKIMLCGAYWLHGSPTRVPEALMIIDQQTWHSEVQAVQWILDDLVVICGWCGWICFQWDLCSLHIYFGHFGPMCGEGSGLSSGACCRLETTCLQPTGSSQN